MTGTSPQRRIAALSSNRGVHRAFSWLHLHELQLRRWQLELIAIPAPPFGEASRAAWFLERFRQLGLQEPQIDSEGNVVALLGARESLESRPVLLLSAHLDTVFPAETSVSPGEDGVRIVCPGACDNGAGLTALLGLAAALTHAGVEPPCPILFAANVGEEGEGDLRGMRHLLEQPPFGSKVGTVIALEGSGNALVVDRALGSRRLRVTVRGPGGHSWADARHPNPILALSSALLALHRLPLSTQPRTTLNVGTIAGGTSVNSIPETASALLDLRSTGTFELDRLELAVLSTVSAAIGSFSGQNSVNGSDRAPLQLQIDRIGNRPLGALPPESLLYASLRAVDRHLGITTEPRLGSTDANLPLAHGIPALAIGAGGTGGGLHSTAEWYDPTGRELALRRILLLVLDACGHLQSQPRDATLSSCPPLIA